jgi:hypothetical protein
LRTKKRASAEQVAGSAHARRIDVGLGQGAGAEEDRNLVGIHPIVLGLAAVDGLHVQGMAEDEGDVLAGAEIGKPVPAEDALSGDDQVVAVGRDGLEEELRIAAQVAVQKHVAALVVEDAQVHGTSVQVDAAVVSMLAGVEAHGPLLGWMNRAWRSDPSVLSWRGPGGACMSIKELLLTQAGFVARATRLAPRSSGRAL